MPCSSSEGREICRLSWGVAREVEVEVEGTGPLGRSESEESEPGSEESEVGESVGESAMDHSGGRGMILMWGRSERALRGS